MRTRRYRPFVLVCISLVLCASCGKDSAANLPASPTPTPPAVAPTPPIPDIAGTWAARLEWDGGVWLTQFTLSQAGAAVTGTWWMPIPKETWGRNVVEWHGTINGTMAHDGLSGRLEMNRPCYAAGDIFHSRYTGPRWLNFTMRFTDSDEYCDAPWTFHFVLDRTCRLTEFVTLACDPIAASRYWEPPFLSSRLRLPR